MTPHTTEPLAAQNHRQDTPEFALISAYTRPDMLADGALIDVTPAAPKAGLRLPVALTRLAYRTAVQMSLQDPPPPRSDTEEARLHALLLSFAQTALRASRSEMSGPSLKFVAQDIAGRDTELYALIEQQEDGSPVLTVLMQGED